MPREVGEERHKADCLVSYTIEGDVRSSDHGKLVGHHRKVPLTKAQL